jgi:uncharacterized membrane protein
MSLLRDRRGGVAIMAAASAGLICTAAAAIDVGAVALEARRLQGAADLAALSAAADLSRAQTLGSEAAAANAPDLERTIIETGTYLADRGVAPADRFQPGGVAPNAVRVTLRKQTPLYFGAVLLGRPTFTLTRSARAARPMQPRAAFSLGSRLAALDGGVANAVLSALTGSEVSLTAMDYEALARADVDLLSWWSALATEANVSAANSDAVLAHRIDAGRALALAAPLVDEGPRAPLTALSKALAGRTVTVGELIALEPGATGLLDGGLRAGVSALDLATSTAQIAGGDRQVALDLGLRPGLAALDASLAVGQPPTNSAWVTITRSGDPVIRTRQLRLLLRARTASSISGLAQADLPLLVELAPSEARLAAIDCPSGGMTIDVRPGLARVAVADVDGDAADFTRDLTTAPGRLLSVGGVVSITGQSRVEAAQTTFRPVTFAAEEVEARSVKSVSTTTIAESTVTSTLSNLRLNVSALGLGLGFGGLPNALSSALAPVGRTLDAIVAPILSLLGLRVGEADVRAGGVECRSAAPRLVG